MAELWLVRDWIGWYLYPGKPVWDKKYDDWATGVGEVDVSDIHERFPPLDVGQCVPIRIEATGTVEGY